MRTLPDSLEKPKSRISQERRLAFSVPAAPEPEMLITRAISTTGPRYKQKFSFQLSKTLPFSGPRHQETDTHCLLLAHKQGNNNHWRVERYIGAFRHGKDEHWLLAGALDLDSAKTARDVFHLLHEWAAAAKKSNIKAFTVAARTFAPEAQMVREKIKLHPFVYNK